LSTTAAFSELVGAVKRIASAVQSAPDSDAVPVAAADLLSLIGGLSAAIAVAAPESQRVALARPL
jgi:hypothetical protein